jgi:pyruvate/2-oxoglutarate dehydrogenase complex dihydrolipoamide dehydrogenase (E3) component
MSIVFPARTKSGALKLRILRIMQADLEFTPSIASSDMAAVRKRKREMVEGLIATNLDRYKASGAELVMGEAKFTGSKTLDVRLNHGGVRTLTGERIFLNLGTHASIPSVPGLAEAEPLTNIEILELDRLPEHLIVIGGGHVGLEFAQAYRRFGSRDANLSSNAARPGIR